MRLTAGYLALGAVLLVQPLLTLPPGSSAAYWILLALALLLGLRDAESTAPSPVLSLVTAAAAAGLAYFLPPAWRPGLALVLLAGLAGCWKPPFLRRLSASARRAGALFLAASLLAGPLRQVMAMLLTWPPAGWAAWLAGRVMGLQVSLLDGNLVLGTPLENQPFPLSPEWTGLPVLLIVAGLALTRARGGWRGWLRAALSLAAIQAWFGLAFLGLCQLGATLDFYELPWHPLVWLAIGLPALWLAPATVLRGQDERRPAVASLAWAAVATLGLALLGAGLLGEEGGTAKAGRVLIDDGHSDWEWVGTPMTPDLFGSKTTYNFHGLGKLLSQYYEVSVTQEELTPAALAAVDVLVLKTPTRPYAPQEIAAVHAFVKAGGGLYLISDHTNVFGMSTWLNQVAEPLGMSFNSDAVFNLWSRSDQVWRAGEALPHPAAAGLSNYHFLTSCSIRPGWGASVVLAGTQAGAAPVCYHESNFFNPHPPRAEFRFGSLVQVAALKVGRGRVLGFTDSTTYSNFAVFWPGRLEQVLAALEWLNRRNTALPWTTWASGAGLLLLALVAWRRRLDGRAWLAAALVAALAALPALRAQQAAAYPPPALRQALPTASLDAALSQVRFPLLDKLDQADPLNLETFFIWLHRTGRLPKLSQGEIPPGSDLHLLINPTRAPDAARQTELRAFVEQGGTLLVALRPSQYAPGLNGWLGSYGLGFGSRLVQQASAALAGEADSVWVDEALSVEGGTPFAWDGLGTPLASAKTIGKGRLVVSGLADSFNNLHLGPYDSSPSGLALESLRVVYRHLGLVLDRGRISSEEGLGAD